MNKLVQLVLMGVLALVCVVFAQHEESGDYADAKEVDVSNLASSLGLDTQNLYEDLVQIRDAVVPLAEQYQQSP